jgi:hypothetical protein
VSYMSWMALVAALACFVIGGGASGSAIVSRDQDGSIRIDDRSLRCGSVHHVLDSRLPNLGLAVPRKRLLVINPQLLGLQPKPVRLFVFHHECGHHHVGASELDADCWAVRRGVLDGWLDRSGLAHVCASFGGASATHIYPSAAHRCRNVARCFANAEAESAPAPPSATSDVRRPQELLGSTAPPPSNSQAP